MGRKMNHSAWMGALPPARPPGPQLGEGLFAGTTGPWASNLRNDAYLYPAPTREE
jgi:hypothetical protein